MGISFLLCWPGCPLGRLGFDGVDTVPFPLSIIMQTLLSAGALTSPSLMSSYRYVSHVSIFPFWTFFFLHLPQAPIPTLILPLSSPAGARTQEGGHVTKPLE